MPRRQNKFICAVILLFLASQTTLSVRAVHTVIVRESGASPRGLAAVLMLDGMAALFAFNTLAVLLFIANQWFLQSFQTTLQE